MLSIITDIEKSAEMIYQRLGAQTAVQRLEELNARTEDPDLWNNPDSAQNLMQERQKLVSAFDLYKTLLSDLRENIDLIELGEAEDEHEIIEEAETQLFELHKTARRAELESLLSGEADSNDTFIEIHAGAGGTESCDWAAMLSRMYIRWANAQGYKSELVSETSGDEAGIKSVTYQIKGLNAYGWLKTEAGVHRLVRISPFDSQSKRHTSFSSVWVYPVIDDTIEVDIQEKDIRIDTYRSSGAGGQHVNTTDSAVRITHFPTGIVVTSSEKSQHQNRAQAMKVLRSRLYELELKKREDAAQEMEAGKSEIGWGHQIRSYVLQPYQLVKDLRTGVETSNTAGVLDGDLNVFMSAALAKDVTGKTRAQAEDSVE